MGQVSQSDREKWAQRVAQGKTTMYDDPKDAASAAKKKITIAPSKRLIKQNPAAKKSQKRISTKR